jgi:hypothetical protein
MCFSVRFSLVKSLFLFFDFLGTLTKDDSWSSCRDGKQKGEASSYKQWSLSFHVNAVFNYLICSSIFGCPLLEWISNYDCDVESLLIHEDYYFCLTTYASFC